MRFARYVVSSARVPEQHLEDEVRPERMRFATTVMVRADDAPGAPRAG
jgi:hypothetical protein